MVTSEKYKLLLTQYRELRIVRENGNENKTKEKEKEVAAMAVQMIVWNCLEKYHFVEGDETAVKDAITFLVSQDNLKKVYKSIVQSNSLSAFSKVLEEVEEAYVSGFYAQYFYSHLVSHKGHLFSLVLRKYWIEEEQSWQSKKNNVVEAEFQFPITKDCVYIKNLNLAVQTQGGLS